MSHASMMGISPSQGGGQSTRGLFLSCVRTCFVNTVYNFILSE